MKILSIDAWREPWGGWTWNNWWTIGNISGEEFETVAKNNRTLLKYLRENNYLNIHSAGRVSVEDDGYNVVICNKNTHEPLYAFEYGAVEHTTNEEG